jgi:hypothetical protein
MIADNRLSEIATWDDRLLAQQLQDLSLFGLDFTIEVIGFEMAKIDLRIDSLNEVPDPGDDPADAVPAAPGRGTTQQARAFVAASGHRVLCGNALDPANFVA